MKDYELASTITQALQICNQMLADGCPPDEREVYLENVLRQAWPHTRAWKYYCEVCGDTGYELKTCDGSHGLCGRETPHLEHDYVQPCTCRRGVVMMAQLAPRLESPDEAGKKTKRWSRFGR